MAKQQDKAQAQQADAAPQLDFAGNPAGTVYNENGKALPLETGLIDLPQDAEGKIMYNEDGSIFSPPADADKTIGLMREQIAGLNLAINTGGNTLKSAQEMLAEAADEDKPVFEKAVNSKQIAIDSNKAKKADLEKQLAEFKLSLITPTQRATERRIVEVEGEIKTLQDELIQLNNVKKSWNVNEAPAKAAGKPKESNTEATAEQKANHAAAVAKYGSQGKAIVAMVKEGKTNTEIYHYLGIPAASVPGPKNDFLKGTPEGAKYKVNAEGRAVLVG